VSVLSAVVLLLWLAACGGNAQNAGAVPPGDLGVDQSFDVPSHSHVTRRVTYPQTPPVGGDHSAQVQPCGYYASAVPTERGVHSMEHGAVWITFRPGLSKAGRAVLGALAEQQHRVLVSPWDNLPAPIVASAWGHQMKVADSTDPRLEDFVQKYVSGTQAPEPGAFC
jgi:hypothetical protein